MTRSESELNHAMNLFETESLRWKRFTGNDRFNYPIDFESALLGARDDGHVDLLYRWAPNAYCHFHRHTAITTSLVLEGELHVMDIDPESGEEKAHRVRQAGDYACKLPGDVHMEKGGPEGALVLFSLFTQDGSLAETLSEEGHVLSESTLEQILRGKSAR